MSAIPYKVKKFNLDEFTRDSITSKLQDETYDNFTLKQILPIVDNGTTYDLYAIYEMNSNLIFTNLVINDDLIDDKYLTAEQIKLLKEIGIIEVNGVKREIEDIVISWKDEFRQIFATISLKEE